MFKKIPSFYRHTRKSVFQELQAWKDLIKIEWKWFLTLLIGIIILLVYTRPFPPNDIYLAVGRHGSSFEISGRRFVPYFADEGIRLHLVYTTGSGESLTELADKDIQVNAAFLIGGISKKGDFPNLVSLGSIDYAPLWLFYRGQEYRGTETFTHFANKRVAIGGEGSGTLIIIKKILAIRGIVVEDHKKNLLMIPSQEALQKLLDGEIDAMCIIDGIDSPIVNILLGHKGINLRNFPYAPAYVKKLPFLDTVVIPKGSLDMHNLLPDQDIQMLASTVTLLVEKDMHPAIQQLFLLTARKVAEEQYPFFAKPEFFPTYVDHTFQLSPVAKRFYDSGPPPLRGLLPLWLISYLDRIWFWVLGGLAVIYPIFKIFPSYRNMHSDMLIADGYEEIQEIEKLAVQAQTCDDLKLLLEQINNLEADSRESLISSTEMGKLYAMKSAANLVRQQIIFRINELNIQNKV